MVGAEKQHKKRVLIGRRGIEDGGGGRAGGVYGVSLRGAGGQSISIMGATASVSIISRVIDGSLAAVELFQGEGSETRHKEGPRGS